MEPSANEGGIIQFIGNSNYEDVPRLTREQFDEYARRYLRIDPATYTATERIERIPAHNHGIRITDYTVETDAYTYQINDATDRESEYWPPECAKYGPKPKTQDGIKTFFDAHPELRGIV